MIKTAIAIIACLALLTFSGACMYLGVTMIQNDNEVPQGLIDWAEENANE